MYFRNHCTLDVWISSNTLFNSHTDLGKCIYYSHINVQVGPQTWLIWPQVLGPWPRDFKIETVLNDCQPGSPFPLIRIIADVNHFLCIRHYFAPTLRLLSSIAVTFRFISYSESTCSSLFIMSQRFVYVVGVGKLWFVHDDVDGGE